MPDSSVPITAGTGTNIDTITTPNGDHRQVVVMGNHGGSEFRANSFRIVGRASGTRQVLGTMFNASGSTIAVCLKAVIADIYQTGTKANTIHRPLLRLYKITAANTGGTAMTKVPLDSGDPASSTSVTAFGDASADGTNSATALAATITTGNIITQEVTPQLFTSAGYEMADRIEFLKDSHMILRASEGVALAIDYPATGSNPITDWWLVGFHWEEFTP